MKKALPVFIVSLVCLAVAIRYFRPDLTGMAEASDDEAYTIADIDQPVPHAVLPTLDGDWTDMGSYRGKVLLINFWATWCPPCRNEMPELIKLQEEFASQGFTIVAIAVDDQGEESVKTFVQAKHFQVDGSSTSINFPVLLGHDEITREIGFEGELPTSILVTRDAREVKIIRGPLKAKELSSVIRGLL
jgi:thiol-disulfide isomerase/thioredoxin